MNQKILLADDHSIVRKGLRFHCQQFRFSDVDEVIDCADLMAALKRKPYTHLILDLALTDGFSLEILPNIRALYPELNILIFSMQPEDLYSRVLETYGITHYLAKDTPEKLTIKVLNAFLNNPCSMKPVLHPKTTLNNSHPLTPRETEILQYLVQGIRPIDIMAKLNIAQSTLATHKQRILEKTNTTTIFELREWARVYTN